MTSSEVRASCSPGSSLTSGLGQSLFPGIRELLAVVSHYLEGELELLLILGKRSVQIFVEVNSSFGVVVHHDHVADHHNGIPEILLLFPRVWREIQKVVLESQLPEELEGLSGHKILEVEIPFDILGSVTFGGRLFRLLHREGPPPCPSSSLRISLSRRRPTRTAPPIRTTSDPKVWQERLR